MVAPLTGKCIRHRICRRSGLATGPGPETVITVQRIAVSQVDCGRKLRIGGMSCRRSKFLQHFSCLARYCSAHLQRPPRSLLYPEPPSRRCRRVTWSRCVGGTGAIGTAAGMVDAIAADPTVAGAARCEVAGISDLSK